MAFNNAHKEYIKSCIDHLLNFDADGDNDLTKQIALLKEAFTSEIAANHTFFELHKCLVEPESMLLGLEKNVTQDKPVSLGDVKVATLEVIADALREIVTDAKTMTEIENVFAEAKKNIEPESFNKIFKTKPPPTQHVSMQWEILEYTNTVYKAWLVLSESRQQVFLRFHFTFPNNYVSHNMCLLHNRHASDHPYNNDRRYLTSLVDAGRIAACTLVKRALINYLYNERKNEDGPFDYFNSHDQYLSIYYNNLLDVVFTNEYYLQEIRQKKISMEFLASLSADNIYNMFDEISFILLKENFCKLETIITLTKLQLGVANLYHYLLKENPDQYRRLLHTEDHAAKFLILPAILHLIKNNNLSFAMVNKFPPYLYDLFTSTHYQDLLLHEDIDWNLFRKITKEQCTYLLLQPFANLIVNKIISFADIPSLDKGLLYPLSDPVISTLLINKKLTLDHLKNMSLATIALLQNHPYLMEWIMQDIVNINDVDARRPDKFYASAFANRLFAIVISSPYEFHKGRDGIMQIRREAREAAFEIVLTFNQLRDDVLSMLLAKLCDYTQKKMTSKLEDHEIDFYKKIFHFIRSKGKEHVPPREIFFQLHALAEKNLERMEDYWKHHFEPPSKMNPIKFFQHFHDKKYSRELRKLFTTLSALDDFTDYKKTIITFSSDKQKVSQPTFRM